MSPRRAAYLIQLDQAIFFREDLRHSYWTGELTWYQAWQLSRLPEWNTDHKAWIEKAKKLTVARLEEEIDTLLHTVATSKVPPYKRTEADLVPAPEPRVQVFFSGPADQIAAVRVALASVREELGQPELEDWQCFDRLIDHFLETHAPSVALEEARADRRLFKRDGWRCRMPGCRGRGFGLHGHHVVFRSRGGSDDDWNVAAECSACHGQVIHAGFATVTGRADGELRVELGTRPGHPPLSVWIGDTRVG
jgi:hypothetical protein